MPKKTKRSSKLLDFYYEYAWIVDPIIAVCVITGAHYGFKCIPADESLSDSTSTIIDNSVSLAGFMLAALTIIVSFRASVMSKFDGANTSEKRRQVEDNMNGLELLLASKNYHTIAGVFQGSLKELLLTFALLGTAQLYREFIPDNYRFYALQAGYTFTILAIVRALLVLFKTLAIEKIQTTSEEDE